MVVSKSQRRGRKKEGRKRGENKMFEEEEVVGEKGMEEGNFSTFPIDFVSLYQPSSIFSRENVLS